MLINTKIWGNLRREKTMKQLFQKKQYIVQLYLEEI